MTEDNALPWDQFGVLLYEHPGEVGRVLTSDYFGNLHPTIQLDIIEDWIADLRDLYETIQASQNGGEAA